MFHYSGISQVGVASPAFDQRAYRLTSIDMLRGLVVVIMALDHVRDFFMEGLAQDFMNDPNVSAALFFTRWITHFCAPVFVFLAGTSAGLMVVRKTPAELGKFLLTRGAWLVLVEWFVIATAFTFAPSGSPQLGGKTFVLLQVIWAIGVGMIVLAACQFLGRKACLALGALILLGHNALDAVWPSAESFGAAGAPLWVALHAKMTGPVGPFFVVFSYPLIPWIGVMLFGFGAAQLFERPARERNKSLLAWGAALVLAFLFLRALDVYGDPNHWVDQARGPVGTLLDFLNTTKYPPSLAYLLMTLGPAAIFCAFAECWGGKVKERLQTFGRAPFAFYIAHFFLIHALSVLCGVMQGFPASDFFNVPFFYPKGYGLPLWGVYLVWFSVLLLLYPLVRFMAELKARSRAWWLSYV
ncbi:MAG TPA: heparan-alpha-glucosaminide N-acetyltransferase domain-containing protein [Steroidobacteraceae bacterium]|nr:heparan-alpha-glucosaminide N-acetyltransferase domain-containing protein [Steroidobacteraceae bacterium]